MTAETWALALVTLGLVGFAAAWWLERCGRRADADEHRSELEFAREAYERDCERLQESNSALRERLSDDGIPSEPAPDWMWVDGRGL